MWINLLIMLLFLSSPVFAQSSDQAVQAVGGFSSDIVKLLEGPIVKVLGAMVLLAGVASLLRGRQQVAVACGIAFIILLFLPSLLTKIGVGGN